MADLRSRGRDLSFDVLSRLDSFLDGAGDSLLQSDSAHRHGDDVIKSNRRKRRHKKKKTKKLVEFQDLDLDLDLELELNRCGSSSNGFVINSDSNSNNINGNGNVSRDIINMNCSSSVETVTAVVYENKEEEKRVYPVSSSVREAPELRQRSGYSSYGEEAMMPVVDRSEENVNVKEVDDSSSRSGKELDTEMMMKQTAEMNVNVNVNGHHVGRMLEKDKSMDWKQVMADKDPNYKYLLESSPIKYFVEEMHGGNSLRTTTTLANEKERERVYDTIFRMPWRVELVL